MSQNRTSHNVRSLIELVKLAELEYANAQIHPDRYDVRFRQRFVEHLSEFLDYNKLLCKYCNEHHTLRTAVAPQDKGLWQLGQYIKRLYQYLNDTGQCEQSSHDMFNAM